MKQRDRFLAHIAEDGREQTLRAHLEETARLAGGFAAAFGAADLGRLCGMAHDLGKYSAQFQARIRGADRRVDHATAGCQQLMALRQPQAAFCVAGHHGGLPNGGSPVDSDGDATLFGRMKKAIPDYSAWGEEVTLPAAGPSRPGGPVADAMLTRMLYSCLVDADYLDTEAFMLGGPAGRPQGEGLPQLLDTLNQYIQDKGYLRPQGPVNALRAQVLAACIAGGRGAPGLFSLTVPTGGGKTLASLAFALNHAVQHGMDRVIYVIPYCSIIDQTAGIFRGIFGADNVLEHHSGVEAAWDEDGCATGAPRLALAAENWDMPIVVTTSVQFFESLYASRPSRCRKLHNIANSVVIFDEAQMLPVPCLRPCVSAIGQLVGDFNVTAVLCTATQPALDGLLGQLAPGIKRRELCPDTGPLFQALRRVTFEQAGRLSNEALAARLQDHRQVLCIVNSRSQAQALYRMLTGEGNMHLSTLMIPAHRAARIGDIRQRLSAGQPCRVISTSLIEAGVDVDFPAVYRAKAGLDAILQAAGRCNREGLRPAARSVVTVFESQVPAPQGLHASIAAMEEITPLYADLDTPQATHAYFTALLDLRHNQDIYGVLNAFEVGLDGGAFPFRTVSERFRLIDSPAKTVYIPTGDGAGLVARLRGGETGRALFRQLGRYGVSVYPGHFDALYAAGDIVPVGEEAGVLINPPLYCPETGLSLTAETGKGWIL